MCVRAFCVCLCVLYTTALSMYTCTRMCVCVRAYACVCVCHMFCVAFLRLNFVCVSVRACLYACVCGVCACMRECMFV